MAEYQVIWQGERDIDGAVNAFERVLAQNSIPIERVSSSVHSNRLDVLIEALQNSKITEYSLYGWTSFSKSEFANWSEHDHIRSARITGGNDEITVIRQWDVPVYDWRGEPANNLQIGFERRIDSRSGPLAVAMEPDDALLTDLSDIVSGCSDPSQIKYSAAAFGDAVVQIYSFAIHDSSLSEIIPVLTGLISQTKLMGTFELTGDIAYLLSVIGRSVVELRDYPVHLSNLSPYSCSFAVNPEGLMHSTLNCDLGTALNIARRASARNLLSCSTRRAFLSWNVSDDLIARPTAGNFCSLLVEKGKPTVYLGMEQYAASDIPVRILKKHLSSQLLLDHIKIESDG